MTPSPSKNDFWTPKIISRGSKRKNDTVLLKMISGPRKSFLEAPKGKNDSVLLKMISGPRKSFLEAPKRKNDSVLLKMISGPQDLSSFPSITKVLASFFLCGTLQIFWHYFDEPCLLYRKKLVVGCTFLISLVQPGQKRILASENHFPQVSRLWCWERQPKFPKMISSL